MGAENEVKTPTVDTDDKYNLDHLNAGDVATPAKEPEKAAAPEQAAPPTPQHDPHIIALAKDLGFTDEQIQTTPPAQLSQSVSHYTRLRLQEAREERERARQMPPAQQPTAAAQPEAEEDEDLSELHPAIRKRLEKQQKELEALRPLKERLEQQAKQEQYRQAIAMDSAVDAAIEELPAKIRKVLGVGEGKLLAKDSAELKRRLLLLQQSNIDPRVESEAVMKRKYRKAAMDIYGDVIPDESPGQSPGQSPAVSAPVSAAGSAEAEPDPDEVPSPPKGKNGKYTAAEYAEAGLATPTGRKAPPRKGDDAAIESMRAWKLKNGIAPKNDVRPADLDGIE